MRYIRLYENFKDGEIDDLIKILKRDCSKFIEELESPLFRGFGGDKSNDVENNLIHSKNVMLENRRPLDVNWATHWILNDKFNEKFGTPVRNGVFISPDPYKSLQYGRSMDKVFMFFPIGNYKYFWSPIIEDMYTYIDDKVWFSRDVDIEGEWENGEVIYYNGKNTGIFDSSDYDLFHFHRYNNAYLYDYKFNSYQQIKKNLETIVNIKDEYNSFEEYEEDRLNQIDEMESSDIEYIVSSYKDNDINDNKENEVSFFCEEYYLVEFKLKDDVKDPYVIFNRLKN